MRSESAEPSPCSVNANPAISRPPAVPRRRRPEMRPQPTPIRCNDCATCYQELPQLFEKATIVVDGEPRTVGRMRPDALVDLDVTAELAARIIRVKATCDAEIIQ